MGLSAPQTALLTSLKPLGITLSGVRSGKSHCLTVQAAYFAHNFPKAIGLIGANTHKQLTESTLKKCRERWRIDMNWIEGRDYVVGVKPPKHFKTEGHDVDRYDGIISFWNGAIVYKASLENAKAHDGKELCWALLDETKDTREDDVRQVIMTRLSQEAMFITKEGRLVDAKVKDSKSFNPVRIYTSPAAVEWINNWFGLDEYEKEIYDVIFDKKKFFHKEVKDKCIVISSTYHNEHNLADGYIEQIKRNNPDDYKRYIYGDPFSKGGNEFYAQFNRDVHITDCEYVEGLPLHISFDQNVNPYITACIYIIDIKNGIRHIKQIDEFCLSGDQANTESLCRAIESKYFKEMEQNGIFIYGDPAGKKSDTRKNEHDYVIIERMFRKYYDNFTNRVPYSHPRVFKRREFSSKIFANSYDTIRFEVNRICKKSIADFTYLKKDPNGKKLKEKDKKGHEIYGHTSDAWDYFKTEALKEEFTRDYLT